MWNSTNKQGALFQSVPPFLCLVGSSGCPGRIPFILLWVTDGDINSLKFMQSGKLGPLEKFREACGMFVDAWIHLRGTRTVDTQTGNESLWLKLPINNGLLSTNYKLLNYHGTLAGLCRFLSKARDGDKVFILIFSNSQSRSILKLTHSSSMCSTTQKTNDKLLARWSR